MDFTFLNTTNNIIFTYFFFFYQNFVKFICSIRDFIALLIVTKLDNYHSLYKLFIEFLNFSLFFTFFIFLFVFLITLFVSSKTIFFRILLTLLSVLVYAIFLSAVSADYFAAFLLAAEVPIILITLLFYFSKHCLQVDTAYSFSYKLSRRQFTLFFMVFLGFFTCIFAQSLLFKNKDSIGFLVSRHTSFSSAFYSAVIPHTPSVSNFLLNFSLFFDYLLPQFVFFPTRNDFYLLFIIYYNINCFLTFILGFLLFFVSCLCIFLYFSVKKFNKITEFSIKNTIFIRKQSLLRQAVSKSRLKFFKKKQL